jgi:membrane-associated phospholipid phosphatase
MQVSNRSQSSAKASGVSGAALEEPKPRALWWLLLVALAILVSAISFWYDDALWNWIRENQNRSIKQFAGWLGDYGDWPELMVLGCAGVGFGWWLKKREWVKVILCMVLASTLAGVTINTVRLTTGRARPNNQEAALEWYGVWHEGNWMMFRNKYNAFPSGHSATAFGFFGVIVFARRRWGWLFLGVAGTIAWSRLYLGAHHLSDVVVAGCVAMFIVYAVWIRAGPWIEERLSKLQRFRQAVIEEEGAGATDPAIK